MICEMEYSGPRDPRIIPCVAPADFQCVCGRQICRECATELNGYWYCGFCLLDKKVHGEAA
jgi:hypothetical protein